MSEEITSEAWEFTSSATVNMLYCSDISYCILTSVYIVCCILVLLAFLSVVYYILGQRFISDLDKRYILITGCDSGFGQLACQRLDALGCHVFAGCRTEEGKKRVANLCSDKVYPIVVDVRDDQSVDNAVRQVEHLIPEGIGLWGLVNNAGEPGQLGPLEWCKMSDFMNLLNINFVGQLRLIKSVLPLMRKGDRCGGRIVNTSSALGFLSIPYAAPYCISKHSVESMSDCLRLEVQPFNISVSLIEPGTHKTNFISKIPRYITDDWNGLSEELKREYGSDYLKQVLFLGTRLIPLLGRSDLSSVVNSYIHALLSQRPRRRYVIGYDAFLMWILSFFPCVIKDIVFSLPGIRAVPQSCYSRKAKFSDKFD